MQFSGGSCVSGDSKIQVLSFLWFPVCKIELSKPQCSSITSGWEVQEHRGLKKKHFYN